MIYIILFFIIIEITFYMLNVKGKFKTIYILEIVLSLIFAILNLYLLKPVENFILKLEIVITFYICILIGYFIICIGINGLKYTIKDIKKVFLSKNKLHLLLITLIVLSIALYSNFFYKIH